MLSESASIIGIRANNSCSGLALSCRHRKYGWSPMEKRESETAAWRRRPLVNESAAVKKSYALFPLSYLSRPPKGPHYRVEIPAPAAGLS